MRCCLSLFVVVCLLFVGRCAFPLFPPACYLFFFGCWLSRYRSCLLFVVIVVRRSLFPLVSCLLRLCIVCCCSSLLIVVVVCRCLSLCGVPSFLFVVFV